MMELHNQHTDDPAAHERIVNLRNGIRSGRFSTTTGRMVFCQSGAYQQLMLVDINGDIVTRDVSTILKVLRCSADEPTVAVDATHNRVVSQVRAVFTREAQQRRSEQQHTPGLTAVQRFLMRELRTTFTHTSDEDLKAQINVLEHAFRQPLAHTVKRDLTAFKGAGLTGLALVQELSQVYTR